MNMDTGTIERRSPTGRRVLLVDDDLHAQFAIKFLIKEWQFDVTAASSGHEALSKFVEQGPFDLIVTDYLMPDMNGWDFARRIRRINPGQHILMLTALPEMLHESWGSQTEPTTGEDIPVNRILPKPPSPLSQLRVAMEELLLLPSEPAPHAVA
jgi:CheY-like chemotaxis protein